MELNLAGQSRKSSLSNLRYLQKQHAEAIHQPKQNKEFPTNKERFRVERYCGGEQK